MDYKTGKKILSLFLAMLLILPLALSCSADSDASVGTDLLSSDVAAGQSSALPSADTDMDSGRKSASDTTEKPSDETTAEDSPLLSPVIVEFRPDNPYLSFYTAEKCGRSSLTDLDGVGCVKIEHDSSGYKPFCTMPRISASSGLTTDHRFVRIVYMTTDTVAQEIQLYNNKTGAKALICPDTSVSGGSWMVSRAADLSDTGILERFLNGLHATIGINGTNSSAVYYIKEISFFQSEEQAYAYYNDEKQTDMSYKSCTFGAGGNAKAPQYDNAGVYGINTADGTLDISYAARTQQSGICYTGKVSFTDYAAEYCYMRVLYSAVNPAGEDREEMRLLNDATWESITIPGIVNTNGAYVLTETTELPIFITDRFSTGKHCSIQIVSDSAGGEYKIKAMFFFLSKEAADQFSFGGGFRLSVNGSDISNYRIVVPENADYCITAAAEQLALKIDGLTGYQIPIVSDSSAPAAYEILIGETNRRESKSYYAPTGTMNPASPGYSLGAYEIRAVGNKLVYVSSLMYGYEFAASVINRTYFSQSVIRAASLDIDDTKTITGNVTTVSDGNDVWADVRNAADPETFSEDFDSDDGYWTEESGQNNWSIVGGAAVSQSAENAITYLHVYEKNVSMTAKLRYSSISSASDMGIITRYVGANAYIKAGYDFDDKAWYIEYREGDDFVNVRAAVKSAVISENTWYSLRCETNGNTVTLYVNDEKMLTASGIHHITPGRVGIYADNAVVSADDVTLVLLSGQGRIMKNVTHTVLPGDSYREGGTVFSLNDGTLKYVSTWSNSYTSTDDGRSWTDDKTCFTLLSGYPNILRLADGSYIQIFTENGKRVAKLSKDDCRTWETKGVICDASKPTGAFASQMNDHITQMSSGRIFWVQGYEGGTKLYDKYAVYCEIYHSDDNGSHWTHSVNTYDIPGNETQEWFGECKILETSDGKLRLYSSWNAYGCIVYSESSDGGKTWGSIQKIPKLVCARSSMQFVRDPYAENDTTYYLVWVYSTPVTADSPMNRSRLALAKSTNGKDWVYLGDIWRWESGYIANGSPINHIVDPFITVTENSILCGSGFSDRIGTACADGNSSVYTYHQAQRQHIYCIRKDTLLPYDVFPSVK